MTKKLVNIGFIGAGSIGSLFGGYLAKISSQKYKVNVVLFSREAHVEVIRNHGLILEKQEEKTILNEIKAYTNSKEFEKLFDKNEEWHFDYLFLTTKAYDSERALSEYEKLVASCNYLVILQNGIGNEEIVERYVKKEKIIRAITTGGALLKHPGHVIHTGEGFTKMGFVYQIKSISSLESDDHRQEGINLLKELLDQTGLECHIVEDIRRESWEKVLVNIGINPFAGLTRLRNGQLLEDENLKNLMKRAVAEAVNVAREKGVNLPEKDYAEAAFDVARKTSNNQNSMLQDILKGKKTEIEFINGKIMKYAEELGIKASLNRILTILIKGIENSYLG